MLVNIKQWYRPESLAEAVEFMHLPGVVPYAGGTSFHRGGQKNISGLIDLRRLGLNYINETPEATIIGAAVTFNAISRQAWSDGRIILRQALSRAASHSLRNLITIGGSLVARPSWSNLSSALLVLDAKVEVVGEESGIFSVEEVLQNGMLKNKSLVIKIIIPTSSGEGCYFRYARTAFDYSIAEMAAYWEIENQRVKTFRLAIANLLPVARRLPEIEAQIIGRNIAELNPEEITIDNNLKMVANQNFSNEFRLNLINQWLQQVVRQLMEPAHAS